MKKLSELTISEEEISNDVIDVSKECGKLDLNENAELLMDNDSLATNPYQFKQSKVIALQPHYDETLLIGAAAGNSNSSCNLNDEQAKSNKIIYQNPSLNRSSNRISSTNDSVIYSSPKVDLKTSTSNLNDQDLFYGSNDLTKGSNFSTFQANNNSINKPIYSTITNSSINKANKLNQSNSQLNRNIILNSNSNLNTSSPSKVVDNFTSKLPPVPRRNSKTQLNPNNNTNFNSNLNLNMPKQLNASLKYVGASNTNLSFSSPVFNTSNNNADDYYQSIDINNSRLNAIKSNDEFDKQTSQIKINLNRSNTNVNSANSNSSYYQKI